MWTMRRSLRSYIFPGTPFCGPGDATPDAQAPYGWLSKDREFEKFLIGVTVGETGRDTWKMRQRQARGQGDGSKGNNMGLVVGKWRSK